METTPHVMLVGQGAQDFATQNGFDLEPDELSENAKQNYNQWLKTSNYNPEINIENKVPAKLPDGKENHDTMGTICIDNSGHLAGMCTTSGMAYKPVSYTHLDVYKRQEYTRVHLFKYKPTFSAMEIHFNPSSYGKII